MVVAVKTQAEAVLFVEQGAITRQMLLPEFDAILDGFVPMPEAANVTARGVYVRIDYQLCITAAVFFTISFDHAGFADKRWNLPLQQLADESARGPDLGAGPIQLACASQCPISWHMKYLWDPEMSPGANDFVLLKKSVKANRLGLKFHPLEEEPEPAGQGAMSLNADELALKIQGKLNREIEQRFRNRMANLLKEQRLRISTLNSHHQKVIQELQLEHQKRLQAYQKDFKQTQKALQDSETLNAQLKETIAGQADKIQGLREYFEHKLKSAQSDEASQLQALEENFEVELQAKLSAATLELREQVQLRDMELMYRNQQQEALEAEIERLREENRLLVGNSGDQLLRKLSEAGVSFVAYHPGAGHLTVPVDNMANYLESPAAYAAEKCGVTLRQYEDWLEHYHSPVCRALNAGEICGESIDRVASPVDFHPGENDRCVQHQSSPSQLFSVVRAS